MGMGATSADSQMFPAGSLVLLPEGLHNEDKDIETQTGPRAHGFLHRSGRADQAAWSPEVALRVGGRPVRAR